ncbi:clavesin-2-like isoform X2 [Oratosquilla oratoria]|uniref:clavesin-2-like isoform X2 n=1 Tax=Oratosquilla oratoria TaxID=337810 RepID=UPI003F771DF2
MNLSSMFELGPWSIHPPGSGPRDPNMMQPQSKADQSINEALAQLRSLLPTRPDIGFLRTDNEFLMRFLHARKCRINECFSLLCRYFEYRQRNRDLFCGLHVGRPEIRAALSDGLPGVLPERDHKGRPVLVLFANNWDHTKYDLVAIYQSLLLSLEKLVEEVAVQESGVVVVVDWTHFPLRLSTRLSPKLLRLIVDGLQDSFPLRFGGVHMVNQPWFVEALLALSRPFLNDKTRSRIQLHGNNLHTLHAQVPPRLLPAELGGEGPEYHTQSWANTILASSNCSSAGITTITNGVEHNSVAMNACRNEHTMPSKSKTVPELSKEDRVNRAAHCTSNSSLSQ